MTFGLWTKYRNTTRIWQIAYDYTPLSNNEKNHETIVHFSVNSSDVQSFSID